MSREKITETNIKQYLRLQEYLIRLHKTGKVCVFTELSGHVDWVDICITPSHEDYETRLYASYLWLSALNKRVVDKIIKEIEQLLTELDAAKEQRLAEEEKQEREMYLRLRKKYGD